MCWVIYYKWFASSSKCITALLNSKTENEFKEMQRCSKAAWTHHERPGLQIATQQGLCTSHCTSALPFLSWLFHHLSFFKPLRSSGRLTRCAMVSINALQTWLAAALLIHSRALPGPGPCLTLCDASLCSEEWSETMKKPSWLGKATSAAGSPEKEQIGTVWGLVLPSPPTAASFF